MTNKITAANLTNDRINALMIEAAVAGDFLMVEICKKALTGDVNAIAAVVDAINDAFAQE